MKRKQILYWRVGLFFFLNMRKRSQIPGPNQNYGYPIHVLVLVFGLLTGCVYNPPTVEKPTTVYEANKERLKKVRVGMSLAEFQSLFSEAYPTGQNGMITAYELKHYQEYILKSEKRFRLVDQHFGLYKAPIKRDTQLLWFYFYKDQLTKWGAPNDWPTNPDQIIEIRQK